MSRYAKGRKFEWEVRDCLIQMGADVTRSAASHTPKDLIAVFPGPIVWFVQCKTDGKLKKEEREALLSLEKSHNITPMLAYREGKNIKIIPIISREPNFIYEIKDGHFEKVDKG